MISDWGDSFQLSVGVWLLVLAAIRLEKAQFWSFTITFILGFINLGIALL